MLKFIYCIQIESRKLFLKNYKFRIGNKFSRD